MSEPAKKRRRSFGFWIAVVFIIGSILYPLSAGPGLWLANRGIISWDLFRKVYTRQFNVIRLNAPEFVTGVIDWYLLLWYKPDTSKTSGTFEPKVVPLPTATPAPDAEPPDGTFRPSGNFQPE